jgi:hypothetical protein
MQARLLVLAALAVAVHGCSFGAVDQDVQVLVPAPPAHWQVAFPGLSFRVTARDASGAETESVVTDGRTPVTITCARAVNVPILAWPMAPHGRTSDLRPAGGFFPLSLRELQGREVVELSWEDGAAAVVVDRAAEAGRDMPRFNVERLRGYLAETGDPWRVDLDAVAQHIARGDLTAWDIDRLPAWDVSIMPGEGTWFLESPFAVPRPALNGSLNLPGVPRGSHSLFSLTGGRWSLEVGGEEPVLISRP